MNRGRRKFLSTAAGDTWKVFDSCVFTKFIPQSTSMIPAYWRTAETAKNRMMNTALRPGKRNRQRVAAHDGAVSRRPRPRPRRACWSSQREDAVLVCEHGHDVVPQGERGPKPRPNVEVKSACVFVALTSRNEPKSGRTNSAHTMVQQLAAPRVRHETDFGCLRSAFSSISTPCGSFLLFKLLGSHIQSTSQYRRIVILKNADADDVAPRRYFTMLLSCMAIVVITA